MKRDKKWAKNEVIKLWGRWMAGSDTIHELNNSVISIIDQLDEPAKVTIPKFVADAFEKTKGSNIYAGQIISAMYESSDEVGYWLGVPSNEKLLLRAWLDGYEIEKEKLYIVQLPTNGEDALAILDVRGVIWNDAFPSEYKMTEQCIKDIDERYWAFAVEVTE